MSDAVMIWPAMNTVLIMFAMGLARSDTSGSVAVLSWPMARVVLGYNVVIPWGVLLVVAARDLFSRSVVAGMALCIVSAGGSSTGASVLAARAPASSAAKLILVLGIVSLLMILALSLARIEYAEAPSTAFVSLYLLLLMAMPLAAGRYIRQRYPQTSGSLSSVSGRLASVSIIALIVMLAIDHGRLIILGPVEPLMAAAVLVLSFTVPAGFEQQGAWRRVALLVTLTRNLALALSLAALLPDRAEILPTVLAFGLMMYIATGVMLLYWRSSGSSRVRLGAAYKLCCYPRE
ncbi:hypothetical protein [Allohahella marinimesophila]|uniref:BASS family bile acid:Na+ symporter n=1 Tax=Allohahella marinimesophila TaxID=1054972 RepID=A0ABP7NZG5_9GAMM